VNRETVDRLDHINRDFYATHAEEFLATRASPWPGWEGLLPHLRALTSVLGAPLRILDVGCGNGRLGTWLQQHLGRPHCYVGLDRSLSLLAREVNGWGGDPDPASILADVAASGGVVPCRAAAYDAVLVLALLHHLPSSGLRRALIDDLLRVLRPGGLLALSCWQFASEERFARRMVSIEDYNRGVASPLDAAQLEEGDHLLRWGDAAASRPTLRYCHFASPDEAVELLADRPATIVDEYRADGREGRLNLYLVARRD